MKFGYTDNPKNMQFLSTPVEITETVTLKQAGTQVYCVPALNIDKP